MSDQNPLERELGRPLSDQNPLERELGRPLARPALPEPEPDFDDQPLTAATHALGETPEHWPSEEIEAPAGDFQINEGDIIRTLEWYFPVIWASCIVIIAYIGIYHAVDQITATNPLPPSWFM